MDSFLWADLYDVAFLLTQGAQFKRVKEFYKNHVGKSFSVIELDGVTYQMMMKLQDPNSEVNFHKFKEKRKKLKDKIAKIAKESPVTELTSKQIYKVHKELQKQIITLKENFKSASPKRIMYAEENKGNNSITLSQISTASLGA